MRAAMGPGNPNAPSSNPFPPDAGFYTCVAKERKALTRESFDGPLSGAASCALSRWCRVFFLIGLTVIIGACVPWQDFFTGRWNPTISHEVPCWGGVGSWVEFQTALQVSLPNKNGFYEATELSCGCLLLIYTCENFWVKGQGIFFALNVGHFQKQRSRKKKLREIVKERNSNAACFRAQQTMSLCVHH